MSRIGKKPIKLPQGVSWQLEDRQLVVKGPKGENRLALPLGISLKQENNELLVQIDNPKEKKALWGLYRSLINNSIIGVTQGFEKKLELQGVGFKANVSGQNLTLEVGFSHPVVLPIPEGLKVNVEKNIISVSGVDKEKVGLFAAKIRAVRKPEPYQGKGIRYLGEIVRRKPGKAAKAAGAAGA